MVTENTLELTIGLKPEMIDATTGKAAQTELIEHELVLKNRSTFDYSNLKMTCSYFDDGGSYIDFEDLEVDTLAAMSEMTVDLKLKAPDNAVSATLDLTGDKQTFLKRHWKVISTVAILIWGLIILVRRLGPSFTD